jgi:hypothetical protein
MQPHVVRRAGRDPLVAEPVPGSRRLGYWNAVLKRYGTASREIPRTLSEEEEPDEQLLRSTFSTQETTPWIAQRASTLSAPR